MNPLRERALTLTRRQLFGRTATGIGVAALGSLINPRLPGAAKNPAHPALPGFPQSRPQGEARHLPVPVRRAVADGSVRPQADSSTERFAARSCPTRSAGAAADGMTSSQESVSPSRRSMFKFAQHGKSGAWMSELLPHTAKLSTTFAFVKSHAHRGHQPRSGDHLLSDRPSCRAGRAWARGSLRPRQRNQDLPAFVVLISQRQAAIRPISRSTTACGAAGFCRRASGREVPLGRRSGAVSVEPARRRREHAPRMLDDLAS